MSRPRPRLTIGTVGEITVRKVSSGRFEARTRYRDCYHGENELPALGFIQSNISPGETSEAVLIPLFADHVPRWWNVSPGDVLRMYEGSRICGVASILWVDRTPLKFTDTEAQRLVQRLQAG